MTISTFSCGTSSTNKTKGNINADSHDIQTDTIILYEHRIKNIELPFEKREMLTELRKEFPGLIVTKEIGQQDGPDFPLYSIKNGSDEICFLIWTRKTL